jgi:hypothetical protein
MPSDLWIQVGRPPQIEFYSGIRKDFATTNTTIEEMEHFGTRLLGVAKWRRVASYNDCGIGTVYQASEIGSFLVGGGNYRGDWNCGIYTVENVILRVRPIVYPSELEV